MMIYSQDQDWSLSCEKVTPAAHFFWETQFFFSLNSSHHFCVCLSGALLENVQVKYRSKVVKYTWPMPSQETDYIPWVCVTLANGETLQTKLLVSLILSRNLWLLLCHFYSINFLPLICFADWCRWTELNGEAGIRNTHSQVELWPVCCGCCTAPIRGERYYLHSVNPRNLKALLFCSYFMSHMYIQGTFY